MRLPLTVWVSGLKPLPTEALEVCAPTRLDAAGDVSSSPRENVFSLVNTAAPSAPSLHAVWNRWSNRSSTYSDPAASVRTTSVFLFLQTHTPAHALYMIQSWSQPADGLWCVISVGKRLGDVPKRPPSPLALARQATVPKNPTPPCTCWSNKQKEAGLQMCKCAERAHDAFGRRPASHTTDRERERDTGFEWRSPQPCLEDIQQDGWWDWGRMPSATYSASV